MVAVRVSAKTEYACIAMYELASSHAAGEPVRIRTIADEHGIPSRFLVQILLQLKGAGLVISTRGAAGGYQLSRSPDDISLGAVMAVIEGPDENAPASATRESAASVVLQATWGEVSQVVREMLQSISLSELVAKVRQQSENMYHL